MAKWVEIARREYELDSSALLPEWRDQMIISRYTYMAEIGQGWVAKKREVMGGLVIEKILWKDALVDRADREMCI